MFKSISILNGSAGVTLRPDYYGTTYSLYLHASWEILELHAPTSFMPGDWPHRMDVLTFNLLRD